jgi:hypothetical protein
MPADEESIRSGGREPHRVLHVLGYTHETPRLDAVEATMSRCIHGAVGGVQINTVDVPDASFGSSGCAGATGRGGIR